MIYKILIKFLFFCSVLITCSHVSVLADDVSSTQSSTPQPLAPGMEVPEYASSPPANTELADETAQPRASSVDAQYAGDLSALENKFYAHDFSGDPIETRLDRIERLVYGSAKTGSLQERVTQLLLDVPNLASSSASLSSPNQSLASPASQNQNQSQQLAPSQPIEGYPYPQGQSQLAQSQLAQSQPIEGYPYPQGQSQLAPSQPIEGYPYPQGQSQVAASQPIEGYPYPQGQSQVLNQGMVSQVGTQQSESNQFNEQNRQADSPRSIQGPQSPSSLKAEVSSMEKQVYGQTYEKDTLSARVSRLEGTVFAAQPTKHFAPITTRISKLVATLQPSFAAPQNLYSSTPVLASTKNANTTEGDKHKQGHPFLKKLGQTLGRTAMVAGSMAVGSMMSGGMGGFGGGMGGYGGGYGGYGSGYGGYGAGYGTPSYGGYRY